MKRIIIQQEHTSPVILPPPAQLFLLITSECNLRCKHCHMWINKYELSSPSLAEKMGIVEQFHQLNPKENIIFCGGELMPKEDKFFALTSLCRKSNLNSTAFFNASLINKTHYERILLEDPNTLLISMDGHTEAILDYIRGTKCSHRHVTKVLADLTSLKKAKYPKVSTKIYTNTVLFEKNIYLFHDYIRFVRSLRIVGARFECLHETHQNKSKFSADPFYKNNLFKEKNPQ